MIIWHTVPTTDTKRLLKTYRENGTISEDIREGSCLKLLSVGLWTKNLYKQFVKGLHRLQKNQQNRQSAVYHKAEKENKHYSVAETAAVKSSDIRGKQLYFPLFYRLFHFFHSFINAQAELFIFLFCQLFSVPVCSRKAKKGKALSRSRRRIRADNG